MGAGAPNGAGGALASLLGDAVASFPVEGENTKAGADTLGGSELLAALLPLASALLFRFLDGSELPGVV